MKIKHILLVFLLFLTINIVYASDIFEYYDGCNNLGEGIIHISSKHSDDIGLKYKNKFSTSYNDYDFSINNTFKFKFNKLEALEYYFYNKSSENRLHSINFNLVCSNQNDLMKNKYDAFSRNESLYVSSCRPGRSDLSDSQRFTCKIENIQAENINRYSNLYIETNNDSYRNITLNLSLSNYTNQPFSSCEHSVNDFDCDNTIDDLAIDGLDGNISGSIKQAKLISNLFRSYAITNDSDVLELALNYTKGSPEDCDPYSNDFNCMNQESNYYMGLAFMKAYTYTLNSSYMIFSDKYFNSVINASNPYYSAGKLFQHLNNENQTNQDEGLDKLESLINLCINGCDSNIRSGLSLALKNAYLSTLNSKYLSKLSNLPFSELIDESDSFCNFDNYQCNNALFQAKFSNDFNLFKNILSKNNFTVTNVDVVGNKSVSNNQTITYEIFNNVSGITLNIKFANAATYDTFDIKANETNITINETNFVLQGDYHFYFNSSVGRFPESHDLSFTITRGQTTLLYNAEELLNNQAQATFIQPQCDHDKNDFSCELETFQASKILKYVDGYKLTKNSHYLDLALNYSNKNIDEFNLYSTCNWYNDDYLCEDKNENDNKYSEPGLYRASKLSMSLLELFKITRNNTYLNRALTYLSSNYNITNSCDLTNDFICNTEKEQNELALVYTKLFDVTGDYSYLDISKELVINLDLFSSNSSKLKTYVEYYKYHNISDIDYHSISKNIYDDCMIQDNCNATEYSDSIQSLFKLSRLTNNVTLKSNAFTLATSARETTPQYCDPVNGLYECYLPNTQEEMFRSYKTSYDIFALSNDLNLSVNLTLDNETDFNDTFLVTCSINNTGKNIANNVKVIISPQEGINSVSTAGNQVSLSTINFILLNVNETQTIVWNITSKKGGLIKYTCDAITNQSSNLTTVKNIGNSFNIDYKKDFGIKQLEDKTAFFEIQNIHDFKLTNVKLNISSTKLNITNVSISRFDSKSFDNYTSNISFDYVTPNEIISLNITYLAHNLTMDSSNTELILNGDFGVYNNYTQNISVFYDLYNLTVSSYEGFDDLFVFTNNTFEVNLTNKKSYPLYNVTVNTTFRDSDTFMLNRTNILRSNILNYNSTCEFANTSAGVNLTSNISNSSKKAVYLEGNNPLNLTYNISYLTSYNYKSYDELNFSFGILTDGHDDYFNLSKHISIIFYNESNLKIKECNFDGKNISYIYCKLVSSSAKKLSEKISIVMSSNISLNVSNVSANVISKEWNTSDGYFDDGIYNIDYLDPYEEVILQYKMYTGELTENITVKVDSKRGAYQSTNRVFDLSADIFSFDVKNLSYLKDDELDVVIDISLNSDYDLTTTDINYEFGSINYFDDISLSFSPIFQKSTYTNSLLRSDNTMTMGSMLMNTSYNITLKGIANKSGIYPLIFDMDFDGKTSRYVSYVTITELPTKADDEKSSSGSSGGSSIYFPDVNESNNESKTITPTLKPFSKNYESNIVEERKINLFNNGLLNTNKSKELQQCANISKYVYDKSMILKLDFNCSKEYNFTLFDKLPSRLRRIPDIEFKIDDGYYSFNGNTRESQIIEVFFFDEVKENNLDDPILIVYDKNTTYIGNIENQNKLSSFNIGISGLSDKLIPFLEKIIVLIRNGFITRYLYALLTYVIMALIITSILNTNYFKDMIKKSTRDYYEELKFAHYHLKRKNIVKFREHLEKAKLSTNWIKYVIKLKGLDTLNFLNLYHKRLLIFNSAYKKAFSDNRKYTNSLKELNSKVSTLSKVYESKLNETELYVKRLALKKKHDMHRRKLDDTYKGLLKSHLISTKKMLNDEDLYNEFLGVLGINNNYVNSSPASDDN